MDVNIYKHCAPIYGKNLSMAWAFAFVKCWESNGGVLAPGIVHFDANKAEEKQENQKIRILLEKQLEVFNIRSANISRVETVANTIFPKSIWRLSNGDRNKFFDQYDKMWPKIKKTPSNRNGVYFRRLTAFGKNENKINQLDHILVAWDKKVHRRSALQAAIFDPAQDHNFALQLGFPCLQQVIFHPNGINGKDGLTVVALYANQLLLEKAYGNYLGLYWLGSFMASEMGIQFKDVFCIASNLKLSDKHNTKRENRLLTEALKEELEYDN